ncbi:MAG: hypothetical protein QOJ88_265 [Pyrinomonadaceae bacterium]|jgi:hypothetical protein|nr:hypothetical protein [Pyrinomonadaceae bacterium]MDQ1728704.1 hypothetical protein [Pyrinomonadaceae bacterium]
MKNVFRLFMILCIALAGTAVFAQDLQTKGSIGGVITDSNGGSLPNAKVTVVGQQGEVTVQTNESGGYKVTDLIPGTYTVTVEQPGFKKQVATNVIVSVGRESTVSPKLEAGNISEVVTVTDTGGIDQQSTATGQNLSDDLFNQIPVPRGVTGLFYLSPGAADSLGGGSANPSIAGGSALDNLYIADGVNITDSAFGGLGTFTRVYGSLGTGINTSFIKEVQIKTGGFEPQYGQSQGGIVNIITQSGGNEYHGAVYGFMRPDAFEATRKQRDDFNTNKVGKILAEEQFDAGVDFGGYVPGMKDKWFFFGSFNPSLRKPQVLGAEGSGLLTLLGKHERRFRTLNYAFKTDFNINSNHSLAFSIFGDPTKTNKSSFNTLNIDNTSAQSVLDFGTRNMALRYNGSLSPTWTLSGSWSWGKNTFNESGFDNVYQVQDLTQTGGLAGQRGSFIAQGLGFFEPTNSNTYRLSFDTSKTFGFLGQHTMGVGYQYQRALYDGTRDRSGPHAPVPTTNASGALVTSIIPASAASAVGQSLNSSFSLRLVPAAQQATCTLCPFLNVPGLGDRRVYLLNDRGEYGNSSFNTRSNYNAAYFQDTWRINKYVTALLGVRNEQERMIGSPSPTGDKIAYSFTGNWAPRIGVTVDPLGRGTTKAYYSFGRFFEYIPLDLAERSLSAEQDFRSAEWAPDFFIDGAGNRRVRLNSLGSAEPIVDSAHLISRATNGFASGITTSANNPTNPILPGTKLGFAQEHILGFEQQFAHNVVFSVRYQDRRLKRIVEDAALVAPEAADFFGQAYFIGNINSTLDAATNPVSILFTPGSTPPAGCDPSFINNDLGVCYRTFGTNGVPAGDFIADGVPDGFPDPVHIYKALEIEVNKRFSDNWQLLSNVRFSSLRGNFEGHFRNDNGQTDPAISSLFDFTEGEFNLLGDQTGVGPLNTDRTTIFNIYGNYVFSKEKGIGRSLAGLNLGAGFHGESGVPISEFLAHPIYLNAGEIPVGGRGKLGRTDWYTRLDLHADYRWALSEKTRLVFISDFFNVFNTQRVRLPDQNRQLSGGINNVDFLQPRFFHPAFNMRLGARLEF